MASVAGWSLVLPQSWISLRPQNREGEGHGPGCCQRGFKLVQRPKISVGATLEGSAAWMVDHGHVPRIAGLHSGWSRHP